MQTYNKLKVTILFYDARKKKTTENYINEITTIIIVI